METPVPVELPEVPSSADGDLGLPALLADSPVVAQLSSLAGQAWLLDLGAGLEQVSIVWISLDAYGEDFVADRVAVAGPARPGQDYAEVYSSAGSASDPPFRVVFYELPAAFLGELRSPGEVAAVSPERTFSPETGGVLRPPASALCRLASRPPADALAVIYFTDLGPTYSLAGFGPGGEGFWSAQGSEATRAAEDLVDLAAGHGAVPPDPHVGGSVAGRGRGGARGGGRATGRGRGRGRATPVPDDQPRPAPPQSLVDEIRTAVRDEVSALSARVSALESRNPTANPGDLLFGPTSAGLEPAAAAMEARRLLKMGAPPSRTASVPGHLRGGVMAPPGLNLSVTKPLSPGTRGTPVGRDALAAQANATSSPDPLLRLVELLERRAQSADRAVPGGIEAPGGGAATSLAEYSNLLGGASGFDPSTPAGMGSRTGGLWALERIQATRRQRPDLVIAAGEKMVKEQLGVLGDEAWSWRRHAETELLPACGGFTTLKRMVAMTAMALDEGRACGPEAQTAALVHIYKVLDATARDPAHEMQWPWPLLGVSDPGGRRRAGWAPGEAAALVAFHRDEAALEDSKKKLSAAPAASQEPPSDAAAVPAWLKAKILADAKASAKGKGGKGGKSKDGGPTPATPSPP